MKKTLVLLSLLLALAAGIAYHSWISQTPICDPPPILPERLVFHPHPHLLRVGDVVDVVGQVWPSKLASPVVCYIETDSQDTYLLAGAKLESFLRIRSQRAIERLAFSRSDRQPDLRIWAHGKVHLRRDCRSDPEDCLCINVTDFAVLQVGHNAAKIHLALEKQLVPWSTY